MKIGAPFKEEADFSRMLEVIRRGKAEGPVPIFEGTVDAEIVCEILGIDFPTERVAELVNVGPSPTLEQLQLGFKLMELVVQFYNEMGYDYIFMSPIMPIPMTPLKPADNPQQGITRTWQEEGTGIVKSRADFEALVWPKPEQINMLPIIHAASKLKQGAKVIAFVLGIFEDLRNLLGFEQLALKSIDDPGLLDDMLERLCELRLAMVEKCAAHPAVGAVCYGEDMGFNKSLMLSPKWFREWVIPRHKRLADACHKHGKPFMFHSCGQVDALMEDLIETVGIDGRHSFQDNIEPVEEVYKKYHDRICIVGGLDVDLLARGTEAKVRKRTRQILEACAPGGGYIMGSGNSVTNYCKVENYFAMLDETRKWNEEN